MRGAWPPHRRASELEGTAATREPDRQGVALIGDPATRALRDALDQAIGNANGGALGNFNVQAYETQSSSSILDPSPRASVTPRFCSSQYRFGLRQAKQRQLKRCPGGQR